MYQNTSKAILLAFFAALSISLMSFFVKLASTGASSAFIVFCRFGINLVYIYIILGFKNKRKLTFLPKTDHPYLHLIRSLSTVTAMLLFFFSMRYISLVNANLLFMTNSLFIPVFAWLCFKTKTNKKTWLSIIIAFSGVALVLKPDAHLLHSGSILALLAGVLSAVSLLAARQVIRYDPPHTLMTYYCITAFLFSGALLLFHFELPGLHTLLLILGVSISGIIYQECLIRSTQYASARTVSTLMYSSIIFSGLLDWLFWKHVLDFWSWIGIALVLCGSLALVTYAQKSDGKQKTAHSTDDKETQTSKPIITKERLLEGDA